ncbi:hypothetical protein SKAU_G00094820 [Synaphobranchus kaupii]|uniref:Uncharacterized protein n=1 Tax=Synaphobranchus kaupii TaxID=118154 RepID=A0A9Q1J6J3_SYNKA|nr:hypothetical protein SKAU_G00094820 [Synaphobranchus kaupii]
MSQKNSGQKGGTTSASCVQLDRLSPAVVHVLTGGTPETATVTLEDCPDPDIREIIQLLQGDGRITETERALSVMGSPRHH